MNKRKYTVVIKVILGMLAPFIISSFFLLIGRDQAISNIMPSWNDEDFYYQQIRAVLQYGHPLGYYGYDGSHALIGNFGFHGFVILLPYVMMGYLLGFQFNTIALTNMCLIGICLVIYILIYKPDWIKLAMITIIIHSPMVMFYINTCMVEGENYFFAIIIALLMVDVIKGGTQKTKELIILGIIIIWAMLSKVTWGLMFFPYMLLLLEGKKNLAIIKRYIIAALSTVGTVIIGYGAFRVCSADYFRRFSLVSIYIDAIREGGFINGILFIGEKFIDNIFLTWFAHQTTWLIVCRAYVIVTLIIAVWFWVKYRKTQKYCGIPVLMIIGYIGGISLLYAGGGTAIRTAYPISVFAQIYMFCVIMKEKELSRGMAGTILINGIIFVILAVILKYNDLYDNRIYYSNENESRYEEIEKYMANIDVNTMTCNPWENTVAIAMNSYPDRIYELLMPVGIGINYYMDIPQDFSIFEAEWVLLSNGNLEDKEFLEKEGYIIIAYDNNTILLKKDK